MGYIKGVICASVVIACAVFIYFYNESPSATHIQPKATSTSYYFSDSSCWFEFDWRADIRCGYLHTDSKTGEFKLPVVVIKTDPATAKPAPILYLQGGPGASAGLTTEGIAQWLSWARLANTQRDLVLIDTRGVGGSMPALQCAAYNAFNRQLMRQNPSLSEELAQSAEVTRACFDELTALDSSLSPANFGSYHSARDVRALMPLLGYETWNIVGVSYGTRLALEVARQESELGRTGLNAMVLDSVYPAGYGGVQTWPQVFDDALQRFVEECDAIDSCRVALMTNQIDDLLSLFDESLLALSKASLLLTVKHWEGEAPIYWVLNDHRLLSVVFSMIYDTERWGDIIALLVAAKDRRAVLLEPLVEPYLNRAMTSDFNNLAFVAVDCADNPVGSKQHYEGMLKKYPRWTSYMMDQWTYQACHWLPSDFPLQAVSPQVPVLLLSGELDPITPVSWAKESVKKWNTAFLITRKQLGHSVLSSDLCLLERLTNYFDGDISSIASCKE